MSHAEMGATDGSHRRRVELLTLDSLVFRTSSVSVVRPGLFPQPHADVGQSPKEQALYTTGLGQRADEWQPDRNATVSCQFSLLQI